MAGKAKVSKLRCIIKTCKLCVDYNILSEGKVIAFACSFHAGYLKGMAEFYGQKSPVKPSPKGGSGAGKRRKSGSNLYE